MAGALLNIARLTRAGLTLAQHGVEFAPSGTPLPLGLRTIAVISRLYRFSTAPFRSHNKSASGQTPIAEALTDLGPTYIKLGQFLAARGDLVGRDLSDQLSSLRDRLPPFSDREARRSIEQSLGEKVEDLFAEFGPPVAAASIAQVHKARIIEDGQSRDVAVKILRPDIEERFRSDLDSFYFAARQIERFHPPSKRLRPVAVVDTLADTVEREMDLRMEAAAISEMTENTAEDKGFRVPQVDWTRTAKRVLTLEWIDGIPLADHAALRAAGHDLEALGRHLLSTFLRHAVRDGFFHADMHEGNLFVDRNGDLVAIDLGIMGRLGHNEKRFLAELLYGFIKRDYHRVAKVHFELGYVPPDRSVETFAQALRAIGEPIMDRTADEISMGHLLGQLFQYTDVFDMRTRPELILLQKTLVVVEGVARSLDPKLNLWNTSEPVVRDWIEKQLGAEGRIEDARQGAEDMGKFVGELPGVLLEAEQAAHSLAGMARHGIRLDQRTIEQLAVEQSHHNRWSRLGIWLGALSLLALAVTQLL